ncbi:MAG: type II toxin-antitoxin system HigB family toxin [Betaproteobacteria bacterium]|nr:type II toxin-antitoxin system HigB family toxin [Betaproteobacteria bacterium]
MKLVGREILEEFQQKHADARGPISTWVAEVDSATWRTSHDIRAHYASASFLADNVVIFNIKGNSYRLEARIAYKTSIVVAVWAGTHADYSKR